MLSGVIFFADYAPEGMSPFAYSAAYNGMYIGAEAVLTIVVLLIPAVRQTMARIRNQAMEPVSPGAVKTFSGTV